MQDRQIFQSKFDSSVTIAVMFKDDEMYPVVKELFESDNTPAFVYPSKKMVIMDGEVVLQDWFTEEHMLVLEAHEIAHIRLGHEGDREPRQEEEADRLALEMLVDGGYESAAELMRQEIGGRYGSDKNMGIVTLDDVRSLLGESIMSESQNLKPELPKMVDMIDAIEHAESSWRNSPNWDLNDFELEYFGELSVDDIDRFEDLSGWLEVFDKEDLETYRDEEFRARAEQWRKEGIPPVIIISAPDSEEDEGTRTQVGDGRGRINFANAYGMKIPTYRMLIKGSAMRESINESVGKEPTNQQMDATMDLIKSLIQGTAFDGKTFAAGGFVRDRIMGIGSSDLDITVEMLDGGIKLANFIARKLDIYKKGSNPVIFPKFGTAKLDLGYVTHNGISLEGVDVEFVQTRNEEYEKGSRKPRTSFGTIQQDVERRDLTINALLMDMVSGEIIDLVGGKADIESGTIRTPMDPIKIFEDDPLRLLRAVRFAGRYGYKMPEYMKEAIERMAPHLKTISNERMFEELYKILKGNNPEKGVAMLFSLGLINHVAPELSSHKKQAEVGARLGHDYISKLALMMLENTPHDVEKMTRRLKMSNVQVKMIVSFVQNMQEVMDNSISSSIIEHGHAFFKVLGTEYLRYLESIDDKVKGLRTHIMSGPTIHFMPEELMSMGIKPGPEIGKLVNIQKRFWYNNPEITKDEVKRRLKL